MVVPGRGTVSTTALARPATPVRATAPLARSGHTSAVDVEQIKPSATVGVRVMAAIILVSSIALLTSGAIVWAIPVKAGHLILKEEKNSSKEKRLYKKL